MAGTRPARRPVDAAFAVPVGFLGVLVIGAVSASLPDRARAGLVVAATALLVGGLAAVTHPLTALPTAVVGGFGVAGFAQAPVGELHRVDVPGLFVVAVAASAGAGLSWLRRVRGAARDPDPGWSQRDAPTGSTLDDVGITPSRERPAGRGRLDPLTAGLSRRRLVIGLLLAAVLLPGLTAAMVPIRGRLALVDNLLVYLLAVVVITLVGGFWAAVAATLAAGLLLNWFFTPPLHTWTIDAPTNMFALLLFLTTAVTVSSVVHLSGRRRGIAVERTHEADALLALARTVLAGDDTPDAVLTHLDATLGVTAHLDELVAGGWVRIAGPPPSGPTALVPAGADFRLCVHGDVTGVSPRLLEGFATQAVSACERQRLRIQAEQTETLAAANRMRTALLAAVSHDLRTPLASVKAAVSTLRQDDVVWTEADRAALLATIEDGTDRLGTLIGNLLDMSRIQTGAVQPFVRPTALEEVLPALTHGLEGAAGLRVDVPDDLPLLRTDPVLLERVLANLVSNALRYSPADLAPEVRARAEGAVVVVEVVDHGPGVAAADRERIFQPFQQLGDHRAAGGVGLGLAVAKGFVEAVGGAIEALSTPGGGLTMRVDVPVAARARDDVVRR